MVAGRPTYISARPWEGCVQLCVRHGPFTGFQDDSFPSIAFQGRHVHCLLGREFKQFFPRLHFQFYGIPRRSLTIPCGVSFRVLLISTDGVGYNVIKDALILARGGYAIYHARRAVHT